MIYNSMKNLINNKYYKTKAEVTDRLNVFLIHSVITTEQYDELIQLTEKIYTE